MKRFWLCLVFAVLVACASQPAWAGEEPDLSGKYLISGWDPGKEPVGEPDYQGYATLVRWGEVWQYRGYMDDMTYAGAGIYDAEGNTLSLSFTNVDGSERGVTVLRVQGDRLGGWWTMDNGGDGELGAELWTRAD